MYQKVLKIAVVDDDQIYQFIINRTFTKLHPNSKTLNFSNCADFFNFLKRNNNSNLLPDLVLLDLNTPFMNGWEFIEAYEMLKSDLAKQPAIYIVTSSIDVFDREKANDYPALSGFFNKPLLPEQLVKIITSKVSRL